MMGISVPQLLIILVIVLVIFGAKRLKNIGSDLGSSVKGFRKAMKDDEPAADAAKAEAEEKIVDAESRVIEGEAVKDKESV